jgi:hypothetical protein
VDLLSKYSNSPATLYDLEETKRQLGAAAQKPGTEGKTSVRNVAPPKRERKPWVKRAALSERFTEEELAQIVHEAQSRENTYATVAARHGLSLSSVERLVKQHKQAEGSN